MTGLLSIDLLGPLTVRWAGADLSPGPVRQQAMLAVLALRANQVTSAEQLLDLVWDDNPPPTGLKVVPTYIYRIRQLLPDDVPVERTAAGYVLRLPPGSVDTERFELGVGAAKQESDPTRAAKLYREALELFQGEPLSGLPGRYLAGQRRRLTERRHEVVSDRIELDLANGVHAEAVPELVALVGDNPLDERFAAKLMTALFRSGRQAAALETYTRTRAILVDQLGVDPGPELQAVHQTILRNDDCPVRVARDELPSSGATFVGRATELAELVDALTPEMRSAPPVVAVDGMAGLGKTALAVRAGRQVGSAYPDGILFVDLHGHTPGRAPLGLGSAVDHLLRSIGVPADRIPADVEERLAGWRSATAGKRLLIILDNALNSRSVHQLLPGAATCAVLVTSRRQLASLDTSHRLALDLLAEDDAESLLAEIVGVNRTRDEQDSVRELVEHCGRLPLAIRIAGSRLRNRPSWPVARLNQRLRVHNRRLH